MLVSILWPVAGPIVPCLLQTCLSCEPDDVLAKSPAEVTGFLMSSLDLFISFALLRRLFMLLFFAVQKKQRFFCKSFWGCLGTMT